MTSASFWADLSQTGTNTTGVILGTWPGAMNIVGREEGVDYQPAQSPVVRA